MYNFKFSLSEKNEFIHQLMYKKKKRMTQISKVCLTIYSMLFTVCTVLSFLDVDFRYKQEFINFEFYTFLTFFTIFEVFQIVSIIIECDLGQEHKYAHILSMLGAIVFYHFKNQKE